MAELFYAVLKASFQGSIVILAVLLLRLALKRAPKSVFCLLWLLAGLRLVLPFEIESNLSLQPQLENTNLTIYAPQAEPDTLPELSVDSVVGEQVPTKLPEGTVTHTAVGTPVGPKPAETPVTFGDIAPYIWLLGMGIMVLASGWSYFKLKRRVRMAYLIENGCFECPGLDTAFVLGFLPPRIYLPAGLTDGEKKFIFDHENTHIARGDHWYKLLGYLVLSLHWFNPLVWVGYSLLCRDIELACDEHVVKFMSLTERKAYSAALLSCGGHTAGLAACPVAFGESNPQKRILNVLNYKRPGFWISLAAVIAVIFVAVCLLTSPGKPSLLEFGNVADEELHVIGISSKNGLADVSHPDEIKNIKKLLKSISWEEVAPEEQPDESGGYVILFNSLLAEDALYFSEDCSLVWAEGTQAYPVSDARKLREYLDSLTEAVWNWETSGEPFADINQPAQWLRGISESAVREARIYVEQPTVQEGNSSTTSRSMGVLSARDFGALLDILNGLPENAIVSESTLRRQSFGTLVGSLTPHGGMTLTVYDDVNQLVMILRLVKNDVVEFILIDELDKVEGEPVYLDHPRCWIIEDDTLLAFLKQMQAQPMIIYPIEFFGHDTSDAEETQPAWNMDMTEEEFLAMCRSAVADIQSRETYHISETLVYYVGDREDARSQVAYWGDGTNYVRQSYVTRTKETRTHLYYDGQLYYRVQVDEEAPTWSLMETRYGARHNLTWLHLLDWDAQMVTFEHAEEVEGVLHVFATVHSTPQTLGWDDVTEYTVGFFFDQSGRLTNVLMGGTKEEIHVMSDLKIETTSADSVRRKLEQFAAERPADLVQELNAQYLEKCRAALESYQAQGSWVVFVENTFTGDGAMTPYSTALWYIDGQDWYKQAVTGNADFTDERCYLKTAEKTYCRENHTIHNPANGDGFNAGWSEDSQYADMLLPWPLSFRWDDARQEYVQTSAWDRGKRITFAVQGSPYAGDQGGIDSYQVTFWLTEKGEIWSIDISYVQKDIMGETTNVRSIITPNAAAPEEAGKMIELKYQEALGQYAGTVCMDPDCTDASHDHSARDCTDPNCGIESHHYSDEHHH